MGDPTETWCRTALGGVAPERPLNPPEVLDAPDNVDEFIPEAEDEIVDALRNGDCFRRWTLRDVLECWLDKDYKRLNDVAAKLQALTTGNRDARLMAQHEAADWLDRMILETIPRNLVEELAEELACAEHEPEDY